MTNNNQMRVIIADDHPIVLLGLRSCLEKDGRFKIVATACDTLELARAIEADPCDFVITDIGMKGTNGEHNAISFLRRFLWQPGRPKVIAVTMIHQSHMLAKLVQLGVDGVLDKRDTLDHVSDAVTTILRGRPYLSPSALELVYQLPEGTHARAGVLSPREWEVFKLYASGLKVSGIAERLGTSFKTVATQKRVGMRKLGLESETQLIEYFRQLGLV
jgi:two-component system, NarL family, captular synthesis response regulator RcsB